MLLASGVVALPDGTELRRGTLIGPAGQVLAGPVATARTAVRAQLLPAMPGLQLLLGSPSPDVVSSGLRSAVGAHPPASYPPLAAPPGPPPSNVDDSAERRFEKILWWLVVLLLLLALLLTGANIIPGPAWAEMRADQALLRVDRGTTVAVVNGSPVALGRGGQVYVASGDSVSVEPRSRARLTFRGGSVALLCAGTAVNVGPLWSSGVRPTAPFGDLTLVEGRLLADTASASRAFEPLRLLVGSAGQLVSNDGSTWYGVSSGAAEVSAGTVFLADVAQPRTDEPLSCGDDVIVPRPVGPSGPTDEPSSSTTQTESPSPSLSPSETPSVLPGPSASPGPSPTVSPTGGQPTPKRTSPPPPRTTSPTPRTTSPTSPRPIPPTITFTPNGNSGGG